MSDDGYQDNLNDRNATVAAATARAGEGFQALFDTLKDSLLTLRTTIQQMDGLVGEGARRVDTLWCLARPSDEGPSDAVMAVAHSMALANVRVDIHADNRAYVNAGLSTMVQLTTELISNACTACAGRPDSRVRVSVRYVYGAVMVTIDDNGVGISDDQLSRVWEPGYSTQPGAAGLGLYRARALVERLEGTIRIDSQPNVGTRVLVRLPAAPLTMLDVPRNRDKRIMIIHDDNQVARGLEENLQELFTVDSQRTVSGALAQLMGTRYDAVLCRGAIGAADDLGKVHTAAMNLGADASGFMALLDEGYDPSVVESVVEYANEREIPILRMPARRGMVRVAVATLLDEVYDAGLS